MPFPTSSCGNKPAASEPWVSGDDAQHLVDAELASHHSSQRGSPQRFHALFYRELLDVTAARAFDDGAADALCDRHDLVHGHSAVVTGAAACLTARRIANRRAVEHLVIRSQCAQGFVVR